MIVITTIKLEFNSQVFAILEWPEEMYCFLSFYLYNIATTSGVQ